MNDDDEFFGYWGICPICRQEPNIINVERNHWAVCNEHRVKWPVGWNVFSSWQFENESIWSENAALLAECREVEPLRPEPPVADADGRKRAADECRQILARAADDSPPF